MSALTLEQKLSCTCEMPPPLSSTRYAPVYRYNLGSAYSSLSQPERALDCFVRASETSADPFPEALANAGGCAIKLGNHEDAVCFCNRVRTRACVSASPALCAFSLA